MIDTLKTHLQNKEKDKLIGLISGHPEVLDEQDENGSSGLLLIVYSGIQSVVARAKELKKSFTFHEAIVCGKMDQVKACLSEDPDMVNQYSADGFTPVSLAAFFDQTEIAVLLLETGADPDLQATNPSKVGALHSAAAKQNYELCKLLLRYGADVNATQAQNFTALHSAAHSGNLPLVELLVENGADITKKTDKGSMAVDFAEKDSHDQVKAYLKTLMK